MSEGRETESPCRKFEMLIMRRLDGEISPEDDARLDEHLASCAACRKALEEYSKVVAATAQVEMPEVSEEQWELYWCSVYNRLERGVAWILVSIGAAAALAWGGFRLVMHFVGHPTMALWAKAGILVLVAGLALLFVSVVREKISLRCSDRYRGVRR